VSCSLKDMGDVIFVGTLVSDDETFHFQVEEAFKGVKRSTIDVFPRPVVEGGTGFNGSGKRYLVFGQRMTMPDRSVVTYVGGCPYQMVELYRAGALLGQLRRQANGRRVQAVFGRLTEETDDPSLPDGPPVPNVTVRLTSAHHTYTGRTQADGSYAIDGVAEGTYEMEADLPPGLEIGKINYFDAEPLEIEKRSCQVVDAVVLPSGRVGGRVIGPDGRLRDETRVDLYPAAFVDLRYPGMSVPDGWVKAGKFTFQHLPPGDYVLVFGKDGIDPANPFPRTFYPDAADLEHAGIIHLSPGQRILDADIHLPAALPVHTVTITLAWNGNRPADNRDPTFNTQTDGSVSRTHAGSDGTYAIDVLPGHTYRFTAEVSCYAGSGSLKSDTVSVDAGTGPASAITLTFPNRACRHD